MIKNVKSILSIVLVFICLLISKHLYTRWDFTSDKRYSFSPSTQQVIANVKHPVAIKIYLKGELTAGFKTLQNEIDFFLNELKRENTNIDFKFINPIAEGINLDSLEALGVHSVAVPTEDKILRVFPYATMSTGKRVMNIPLLGNQKIPIEERALAATDDIESNFVKNLYRLTQQKRKKIGLIIHHNELLRQYMEGFLQAVNKDYDIEPYTQPVNNKTYSLNSRDLQSLKQYDALVVAKPLRPFTEEDKLILDQYVMHGGKMLWMVESVDAEMDSLLRSNKIVAFPRDSNIKDLLFNYGVRIIPAIVKDLQSAYITLGIGNADNNTAYEQFPWVYFPVSMPSKHSLITKKINNPLRFEFANPVEILPRDSIKAEVLLSTSANVSLQQPMSYIDFSEIGKTNAQNYPPQEGVYPLAVLLEGNFRSAYAGRYIARDIKDFKTHVTNNKMIVIGDGDFAKNHIFKGIPLPLGADKYSMRPDIPTAPPVLYDNASFITNCLNYLVGDTLSLSLAAKERKIFLLNKAKVKSDKLRWRGYNLFLPTIFIALFGLFMQWYKRKKFMKKQP